MAGMWHQQFRRSSREDRTDADGILHASVEEKMRWAKLSFDQKLGLIRNLKRQVHFPLVIDEHRAVRTPTGKIARYTPDFTYERLQGGEWVEVIEDHKGFMDKVADLRIAVFEAIYQKKVSINKR